MSAALRQAIAPFRTVKADSLLAFYSWPCHPGGKATQGSRSSYVPEAAREAFYLDKCFTQGKLDAL